LIVNDLSTANFELLYPMVPERLRALVGVPLLMDLPLQEQEDRQEQDRPMDTAHAEQPTHPVHQPLLNQLVGVLCVGSTTPRRFSQADVQLLQRAADRLGMAISRTRLYAAEQDARVRAEAALARAQASEAQAAERAERLHAILETMADGVAVYDIEGRPLQLANRAYHDLYALQRAPEGFEALPAFERAALLHVRDAATGAPLAFEQTPPGRAL